MCLQSHMCEISYNADICLLRLFSFKALFRKIAAALPGMEALSSHKDDLVDVNLKPTPNPQEKGKTGGCAC